MNVIDDKVKLIYKNTANNKVAYSIGLSKKKEDGSYENGYMPCRFRKDVELDNQTKIKIKSAWLDFYKVDKKTFIYLFINEFEKVEQKEKPKEEQKSVDNFSSAKEVKIEPDDLPFY